MRVFISLERSNNPANDAGRTANSDRAKLLAGTKRETEDRKHHDHEQ